jgi:hypothetical protein
VRSVTRKRATTARAVSRRVMDVLEKTSFAQARRRVVGDREPPPRRFYT